MNRGSRRPTSLPTGIPLPRARVRPMTLATKALSVKYSFSTTPLRIVFSSGIPEPEAEQKGKGLILVQFAAHKIIMRVYAKVIMQKQFVLSVICWMESIWTQKRVRRDVLLRVRVYLAIT